MTASAVAFPGTAPGSITTGPFTSTIYGQAPEMDVVAKLGIKQHDPKLVRVVARQNPQKKVKFTLTSPFANKQYCLPTHEAHAVFYDNSNCPEMRDELLRILHANFDSWTLVEDRNAASTFETNITLDSYPWITRRVAAVYGTLFPTYLADAPIVFNLEDDVEIGPDAFQRLWDTIHMDDRIATVIGNQRDRRTGYASTGRPIAFELEEVIRSGHVDADQIKLIAKQEKKFGIEAIGSGHLGCWMTRRSALEAIDIGEEYCRGMAGPDIIWGWRVNRANQLFVINWSVECRHWFQRFGRPVSL